MEPVTSKDGTKIAFEKRGNGPALIIVFGALADHTMAGGPQLAEMLAQDFTVYDYDRRGKGQSGDTLPYAVEREIEDLEVLIGMAGGGAYVYGHSSGAALALQAAARPGSRIRKLALYEIPYNDDPQAKTRWKVYIAQLSRLLAEGKKGDAVTLFLQYMGTPAEQVEGIRHSPFWPAMEAASHTLAYDHTAILGDEAAVPRDIAGRVTIPTLVMAGRNGVPSMRKTAETLRSLIPHARLRILEGQTHEVSPAALAPVLREFFR